VCSRAVSSAPLQDGVPRTRPSPTTLGLTGVDRGDLVAERARPAGVPPRRRRISHWRTIQRGSRDEAAGSATPQRPEAPGHVQSSTGPPCRTRGDRIAYGFSLAVPARNPVARARRLRAAVARRRICWKAPLPRLVTSRVISAARHRKVSRSRPRRGVLTAVQTVQPRTNRQTDCRRRPKPARSPWVSRAAPACSSATSGQVDVHFRRGFVVCRYVTQGGGEPSPPPKPPAVPARQVHRRTRCPPVFGDDQARRFLTRIRRTSARWAPRLV
jgi:hypothetical protein